MIPSGWGPYLRRFSRRGYHVNCVPMHATCIPAGGWPLVKRPPTFVFSQGRSLPRSRFCPTSVAFSALSCHVKWSANSVPPPSSSSSLRDVRERAVEGTKTKRPFSSEPTPRADVSSAFFPWSISHSVHSFALIALFISVSMCVFLYSSVR